MYCHHTQVFFLKNFSFCIFIHMYACVECVHVSTDTVEGQRYLIPLKLELQVAASHPLWVLGTKLRSSCRAVSILNL